MKNRNNKLVIGDTTYEMDAEYRRGALDARLRVPYQWKTSDQWGYGHTNECAGEHYRFGMDLIAALRTGSTFQEDPSIPRDDHGNVDLVFIEQAIKNSNDRQER